MRSLRLPRGTLLVALSLVLALLASGVLLVVPTYTGVRASVRASEAVTPGGAVVQRTNEIRRATLVEVNGPRVLRVLAVPVVLAALPLAANWTRLRTAARALAALLLTGFALVTGFSIGLFYLPTAGAMVAAALRGDAAPPEYH